MNLKEIYGFDEMFDQITGALPDFRLHITRKNDQTIVSSQAAGLVSISTGTAGAAPGPLARDCLVDLHARLVVRDNQLEDTNTHVGVRPEASVDTVSQIEELLLSKTERRYELSDNLFEKEEELEELAAHLADLDLGNFDETAEQLKRVKQTVTELRTQICILDNEILDLDDRLLSL